MEMKGDQARQLSPAETEAPVLDGPVGEETDLKPKGTPAHRKRMPSCRWQVNSIGDT